MNQIKIITDDNKIQRTRDYGLLRHIKYIVNLIPISKAQGTFQKWAVKRLQEEDDWEVCCEIWSYKLEKEDTPMMTYQYGC